MGEDLDALIKSIAEKAWYTYPYPTHADMPEWLAEYERQVRVQLAVALAHGNHLMVEEACMRSRANNRWSYGSSARHYRPLRKGMRATRFEPQGEIVHIC